MADVVKNNNAEEQIDEAVVEESETVTEQENKTAKTFSQTEVNRIVQSRVKKLQSESESEIASKDEQISKYEEVIQKILDAQMKGLDAPTQKLLKKLSVLEQLEFLGDETNFETSKKKIPTTPKPDEKTEQKPIKKIGKLF